MMLSNSAIDPAQSIPASIIATSVSGSMSHIDRGTPMREFQLRGLRATLQHPDNALYSISLTTVLPTLPVMPTKVVPLNRARQ